MAKTHNSDKIKKNVEFEDFLSDDINVANELNKNEVRAWKNSAIVASTNAPDLRSSTVKTNEIQGWKKSTTLQKQALRFDASANPTKIARDTDDHGKSISLRKSQL